MLFGSGVEQGSNAISVQQGFYQDGFDFAAGTMVAFSWAYVTGSEVLDLADPQAPSAPPGVYTLALSMEWNETEAGAMMYTELVADSWAFPATTDLGVSKPATTGGGLNIAGTLLTDADASQFAGQMKHDRAGGNVSGTATLAVTRLY